jgi:hypothetical protein
LSKKATTSLPSSAILKAAVAAVLSKSRLLNIEQQQYKPKREKGEALLMFDQRIVLMPAPIPAGRRNDW